MLYINHHLIQTHLFPNKEFNLDGDAIFKWTKSKECPQFLTMRFETNEDLIALHFLNAFLTEHGYTKQVLILPYLPYSRMDRKVNNHLFSLRYIADFINHMKFEEVRILEVHSPVALAIIERSVAISVARELTHFAMEQMQFDETQDIVVFPDKGAAQRYKDLLPLSVRICVGQKTRVFDTGKIEGVKIEGDTTNIRHVLVIDDLCSRGGTCIEVANALKQEGAENIYLAVTHLEDNVFTGSLFNHIKTLFTTDAMEPFLRRGWLHEQINIFPLSNQMYVH